MSPHEREREARRRTINAALSWMHDVGTQRSFEAQLDELVAAVEARVRWDQQAQAEANG